MNFTSPEHLHLLQFVVPHKTGTPLLMSPEWIHVAKTSNWAHEVTSVDSSTKSIGVGDAFICHLVFHIFRHIWNAPLNSTAGKRYLFHVCLTTFSKKQLYCFQQTSFTSVYSNRVSFFVWQFQVRLHMRFVFSVKTSGKMSLWHFKLVSWRRKNSKLFVAWLGCFVSKCRNNCKDFVYLTGFIPLQYASSWMLIALLQQYTVGRLS